FSSSSSSPSPSPGCSGRSGSWPPVSSVSSSNEIPSSSGGSSLLGSSMHAVSSVAAARVDKELDRTRRSSSIDGLSSFALSYDEDLGRRFWSSVSRSSGANASLSPREHATIGHHRRHQPSQSDRPRSNQRIELDSERAWKRAKRSEPRNRKRTRARRKRPLG